MVWNILYTFSPVFETKNDISLCIFWTRFIKSGFLNDLCKKDFLGGGRFEWSISSPIRLQISGGTIDDSDRCEQVSDTKYNPFEYLMFLFKDWCFNLRFDVFVQGLLSLFKIWWFCSRIGVSIPDLLFCSRIGASIQDLMFLFKD